MAASGNLTEAEIEMLEFAQRNDVAILERTANKLMLRGGLLAVVSLICFIMFSTQEVSWGYAPAGPEWLRNIEFAGMLIGAIVMINGFFESERLASIKRLVTRKGHLLAQPPGV